ncbi:LOW QUALITY PROTEIN: partitioning defective 3 homolog [Haliotis rubra]|uniref:LOW QUALITY PROTEIN: partitioning defective 3 homolog n=1 Tax=Haliotis rubra TaxID=36100 RepID=UPI001EE59B52|nr:LOW QUALITY PROTEIN: partitioning defective 3 homolog [Haliotis rubra]
MKVTVCFEEVRVIVPCGDGEILVRELIDKAITRYKKATGKSNNHWVSVHNVKAISGGGILDPDDQLNDVVDDREQLIADFEEQGRPGLHHNGGDGASASSTGTASPDIFQTGDLSNAIHRPFPISLQNGKTDVIVTPRDLSLGTSLTVRRGSEPALNLLTDDGPLENGDTNIIPGRGRKESHQESDEPRSESESDDERVISRPKDPNEKSPLSRFQRDSKRQSLSNNPDMYRWLEAHDNQQDRLKQQVVVERKGPIGGSGTEADVKPPHKDSDGAIIIVLKNDGGPLGIHVIPDIDDDGRELGLVLQGIEKGGRIERDGRLRVNDRIIEINGRNLEGVTFDDAQKIFRDAMRTAEVRLKVVKHRPLLPKQPPPLMPKPKGHAPVKPSPLTLPPPKGDNSLPSSPEKTSSPLEVGKPLINNNNVNEKNVNLGIVNNNQGNKMPGSPLPPRDKLPIQPGPPLKVASPTKKTPPAVPQRHPSTTLSAPKEQAINTLTNTRKIGRKIQIQLQKGALGLGFSITSRDNPTGESPIYIKNILVKGAAVQDGRLKPGDRLLEVNGMEMTGKSQSEAVGQLRSIPEGHVCNLVVSRQEVVDELFRMPRELSDENTPPPVLQPGEVSGEEATVTNIRNKEVIKFEIPLNDTGSAGLGVSVKGKTTSTAEGTKDLGIFIKSVMHGGAASKDGRLFVNDQLLEVHGIPLTNMSNVKAMDQLRRAMQVDGPMCGFILLTVARKIGAPSPFLSSENSLDTTDGSQFEVLNHGVTIYGEKNHSRSSSGDNTLFLRGENSGQTRGDNSARTRADVSGNGQPNGVSRTMPSSLAVDRLMTGDGGNGLRNESYNRATHESFEMTPESSPTKPSQLGKVAGPMRDDVIIENDMYAIPRKRQPPPRPHSTLGIPHISPAHSRSSSMEDYNDDQHHRQQQHQRGSASDWSSKLQEHDELSPTGDFEFQREGFGRQSMSEKRKGHIDPRGSGSISESRKQEIPKRNFRLGEFSLFMCQVNTIAPFPQAQTRQSNLKRSSSFEDLASDNVPQMEVEEIPAWRFARIGRPRACNDSFRAAVDRSYDAPTPDHNVMDTLEEESMESGSLNQTQSNSARSSFSSENTNEDFHSLRKKKHKDKKGGGILKGLIRLSKGRKSNEENVRRSRSAERPSDSDVRARQLEQERLVLAQQEQDRPKERQQMEILEQQKQQQLEQQKQQQLKQQLKQQQLIDQQQKLMQENRPMFYDPQYIQEGFSQPADRGMGRADQRGGQSRAEKIQQLRVHHQQQHRDRHGQYPHEDAEEFYERQIQEEERKRIMERERELAGRLRPPSRTEMERVAHVRMGSHDSASNFHQYPSVSDTSSYSDQSQHSHFSHNNYPHQRDRPQSRGVGQYPDPPHPDRPSSRGPQQYADEWYQTQPDFTNVNRQTAFTRLNPKNGAQFYGDPARAYRDPKYPAIAGRRPVQTITDPSSAKV